MAFGAVFRKFCNVNSAEEKFFLEMKFIIYYNIL